MIYLDSSSLKSLIYTTKIRILTHKSDIIKAVLFRMSFDLFYWKNSGEGAIVRTGDWARVRLDDGLIGREYERTRVRKDDGAIVRRGDCANGRLCERAIVRGYDGTIGRWFDWTRVWGYERTRVWKCNSCLV